MSDIAAGAVVHRVRRTHSVRLTSWMSGVRSRAWPTLHSRCPRRRHPGTGAIFRIRIRRGAEYVVIPLLAIAISGIAVLGASCWRSASPRWSFSNSSSVAGSALRFRSRIRCRPPRRLILTALCVALPARIGLVIIGGEGALVLGGFASAAIAIPLVDSHTLGAADACHYGDHQRYRWRLLDRDCRLSALRARRQRNDLVAADDLYRHRHR